MLNANPHLRRHIIHHYGQVFVRSFLRPALLFFVILGNFILFTCATLFWKFELGVNPNINSYWDGMRAPIWSRSS